MIPTPDHFSLPYRLGVSYLEREALRGRFRDAVQSYPVHIPELSNSERERFSDLFHSLGFPRNDAFPIVQDTGVGLHFHKGDGDQLETVVLEEVRKRVGPVPEFAEPPTTVSLLNGYTSWRDRWRSTAVDVLQRYLELELRAPHDEVAPLWRVMLPLVRTSDNGAAFWELDGRRNLMTYIRARASQIRLSLLEDAVSRASFDAATAVINPASWLLPHTTLDQIVDSFEERSRRIVAIAWAHQVMAATAEREFIEEMRRWADALGSERLRMGMADGYRMTAVYLDERIALEAPGFYAVREKSFALVGKERSGPSEAALRLRRAVQRRLDEACVAGGAPYEAVIRWVGSTDVPAALRDEEGWDDGEEGEAIVIGGWLDRYQLIGLVDGPESRPWFGRLLAPADYGLPVSSRPGPSDDDIPF